MQINPGNFDKKIEIIKYQTQKDSDGFENKKEITVLNTWAQVTNVSGTEVLRSNSDFSEVKTSISNAYSESGGEAVNPNGDTI